MAYKRAFQCKKCPENNGPDGCPMWWETVWENAQGGETKLIKACGYTQLPLYLTEVIKASNRPAAATEGLRNQVARLMQNPPYVADFKEITATKRLGGPER